MNYDLFIPVSAMTDPARPQRVSTRGVTRRDPGPSGTVASVNPPPFGDIAAGRPSRQSASDSLTTEEVERAAAAFNEVFQQANVGVRYKVDEATGETIVLLVDRDTDKVLRQVPPEEILRMRQRLRELMGIIFDTTA